MGVQDASLLKHGSEKAATTTELKGRVGCVPPAAHTPPPVSLPAWGPWGGRVLRLCSMTQFRLGACSAHGAGGDFSGPPPHAPGARSAWSPSDISPSHSTEAGEPALLLQSRSSSRLNKDCHVHSNSSTDGSPDGSSRWIAQPSSCHSPKSRAVSAFGEMPCKSPQSSNSQSESSEMEAFIELITPF